MKRICSIAVVLIALIATIVAFRFPKLNSSSADSEAVTTNSADDVRGQDGGAGSGSHDSQQEGTADRIDQDEDDNQEAEPSDNDLTPSEQALSDEIDELNGEDDKTRLLALDGRVRACKSAKVRESYLDAVSFYGAAAIGTLAAYLGDPNEDVSQTAKNHFESAVSEIEDEAMKLDVLADVFRTSSDEEFLDSLSTEINSADEKLAIETILKIFSNGTPEGIKVASESYEFITGEEFTDVSAAEAWLAENYTPPEDDSEQ